MMNEEDMIVQGDVFSTYNRVKIRPDCPKDIKEKMRWGTLDPPIDIYEAVILVGRKGKIKYMGRRYSKSLVISDLEEREIIGKTWLLENIGDEPLAGSR